MKLFDLIGKKDITSQATTPDETIKLLQRQNRILTTNLERNLMISHALWEIVKLQCGLGDEDILRKVSEIDLRDGQLDGKNQGTATNCPNCKQSISTRNPACPYCGQILDDSVFS